MSPARVSGVDLPPAGRTARRVQWHFLPPGLRQTIEAHCGAPVVAASSQDSGYTPGFASTLTCADGSRHFVKAASVAAQQVFAEAYREEARKLARLPAGTPAAHLLWVYDDDGWVVLGLEHVAGRSPRRPWAAEELDRTLDALETAAALLTPPPAGLELATVAADLGPFAAAWDHVRDTRPGLPHLEEAADLAAAFARVSAGDTLVHTDVRDDNVLLEADGGVRLCDWNWPVVGAAWLDTVFLLLEPWGDGLDADVLLAERPLTRDVPTEHVDATLALLAGYFLRQRDEPTPATSPYLRQHQAWCAEAAWGWLSARRGWT